MKILHIVTLIDQERTYGGPVSVAVNLAEEQVRQGHQVTILSLAPTSSDKKKMYSNNGVDFVAFRASHLLFLNSFSSMFSFASVKWLFGTAKIYDVAHLHFSRDLFQVTSARIVNALKVPLFLQTHGMITNAEAKVKKIQRLYDAIFVKPAFQQAKQVLALQKVELAQLKSNFGISNVRLLANGVQMAATFPSDKAGSNLVAFVSRLHPRKNPLLFLESAKKMIGSGFKGEFVIAGPDGGLANQVSEYVAALNHPQVKYLGSLSHPEALALLRRSNVLVLPSKNETFPMVVLEALSVGTPVAVSRSCQIADLLVEGGLGTVFDETPDGIETAIHELLGTDISRKAIIESSNQIFGIRNIVTQLLGIYDV